MKKLLTLFAVLLLLSACAPAPQAELIPRNIFYAGDDGSVKTALSLAGYTLVTDPAQADVFVLNGEIPSSDEITAQIENGAGIVLILGQDVKAEEVTSLTGLPMELTYREGPISLTEIKGLNDPLTSEIVWNSAPQIRAHYETVTALSSVQPLVTAHESGEWVLWRNGNRNIFIVNAFLSEEHNPQIQEWGYFNYLIYHLVERAAGATPMSFASYPASPVPHAKDRNALFLFLAAELTLFFGAFVLVRRWSLKHPEALDSLVANRSRFEVQAEATDWEKVGFHRPLSGLLVGMGIGIIMFIPLIIYQNLILPQFILPSAQALGTWGRVTQLFGLAWAVFDVGTSAAAMKYLSQYRVSDPRRGYKYVQVYVWWQALSGAIQVAIVVALTSLGIVHTPYALFAWSIVIHAFIQIPGFYGVFRTTLNGLQRADYARYLDAAWAIVFPILTQLAIVPVFYAWGRANPSMGAAMGGVLGLGAAAYALELSLFVMGMWLYKRIGYRASVVFMAHFDWAIIKETFSFGVLEMLGGILFAGGQALEIWITQNGLVNYAETWGNWALASNFLLAFTVSTNLFDGVMPAVSEALSSGKKLLSQYYSVQSYKWGGVISASLAAILLVVAPRFILGSSGEEFQRAAVLAIPLTIFGSIQFLGWLGDALFLGANRPFLRAMMVLIEQGLRIGLLFVLLGRFQIVALVIAYFIGILVRGVVSYFVAHKFCFPQKFYFWQSLAAPVLAAGLHYLFLSAIAQFVWKQDEISSIILFFIGLLPAMPVFFFFYAFVGGWDDAGLDEVAEAAGMTGFLRPVIRVVFVVPSRWGARISPLHNRFPITMRNAALAEAQSLTDSKVKLVNGTAS